MSLEYDVVQEEHDKKKAMDSYEIEPFCEFCGESNGLLLEPARTAYNWHGEFDSSQDPNRDKLLCRKCAVMHHEFWDEMWKKYKEYY